MEAPPSRLAPELAERVEMVVLVEPQLPGRILPVELVETVEQQVVVPQGILASFPTMMAVMAVVVVALLER